MRVVIVTSGSEVTTEMPVDAHKRPGKYNNGLLGPFEEAVVWLQTCAEKMNHKINRKQVIV